MTEQRQTPAGEKAEAWHAVEADAVLRRLDVDADQGLSTAAAAERRQRVGPNLLARGDKQSLWGILLNQVKSLVVILLAVAAALAMVIGQVIEGIAVAAALLFNTLIGFVTEWRARQSVAALHRLGRMRARVLRTGQSRQIDAVAIVPGDVLLLEEGDVVPADARLVDIENLQVDESALTGESVPVDKATSPVTAATPLAERRSMVYRGTAVTRGQAKAVVVATGLASELGRISEQVATAEAEVTPLEKRLDQLGRRLIWLTVLIGVAVAAAGIAAGKSTMVMAQTAIALAIAAVPEGLPIVATLALATGMRRMARRYALVKRLAAVETLGATSLLMTDKTGTLTENRMRLAACALPDGDVAVEWKNAPGEAVFQADEQEFEPSDRPALMRLLEIAVLCNNARSADSNGEQGGDPLEVALLEAGAAAGHKRTALLEHAPEIDEISFDSDTKMMATYHRGEDGIRVAVKGAPEAVFAVASRVAANGDSGAFDDQARQQWHKRNEALAGDGLRVIALAEKTVADADAEAYEDLTLVGLIGLLDPPRPDARRAIETFRQAGVRVVMVTGDQKATARHIARAVNLADDDALTVVEGAALDNDADHLDKTAVYARVTPDQKLDLIAAYQKRGEIVGMTGDGVNDAPALKKADIGVAMGKRGTEVAREAADIVLVDDSLQSIAVAIGYGRAIFNNIRRFIVYLLSGNLGEIFAITAAAMVNAPLPLLPLQILFINLVFDVFPALALGMGRGEQGQMRLPPRNPGEAVLTQRHWRAIVLYGVLIAAASLTAFAAAFAWLGADETMAVTIAFMTFGFARLWHLFNMRGRRERFWRNSVTTNPFIWCALGLCCLLMGGALYWPLLATVLALTPPGRDGWLLVLAASLLPVLVVQTGALLRRSRS
ncbi:MAG: cation-transporting P-type ATPase [Sphingomonadales bacterium]